MQLNRKTSAVDVSTSTVENDDHRRKLRSSSHSKKSTSSPLRHDANKSRVVSAVLKTKSRSERNLVENIEDMDRSSPSGQSQSDHSEHDSDIQKPNTRPKPPESLVPPKPRALRPNLEDLYAKPNRRKRETGPKTESGSKPDPRRRTPSSKQSPTTTTLDQTLRSPLPRTTWPPPAGFADTGSDSEDSDSGLSGVSGGHQRTSPLQHAQSEDNILGNDPEQVTEEQFRSWEYLLARNAKLLFMRELDTLTRSNSRCSPLPTASAPDLVTASTAEPDATTHFQRNPIRKSRLGRGTFRLIQSKLSATTKPPETSHYPLVQPDLATEMQERPALDSLELETRMHHYWHTGVTNF
ncbi:putative PH domain leucine-rich repeat-containing protein phosphatase 2 isoform X1 [Penaeus vannamei]|uniref:Putative PH domain leucine-rich repeat-containing protein phosphatase 2 isoform X1 n=1 Tax=Penaeus vannamei TaxID=6689 RepID=A0A3R7M7Y8_PENVA|nr:putative PH domain leucine-rich repeat-containing protein phosphatase 2 isoform X1 [Penaeus vannamei]